MHTDTPHKPRFQLWAALIAGMIALPASAADVDYAPLVPYEARYTASMSKGVSLNGEGVRELTDQGNNVWLYRTDVDSFIADINESLIFRWEDGQVIPLRYRYHLSGFLIKDIMWKHDGHQLTDFPHLPTEVVLEFGFLIDSFERF